MSNDYTAGGFNEFVGKHKRWFWIGGIAIAVLILLAYFLNSVNVRNEGERQEQALTALHGQSMNALSACFDQGDVAAQVTVQEYESIKEILIGAVSARYVDDEGNDTNATPALGGGHLISALQEQYPQIDQRSWQNLQTLVIGCRDEFQGTQDRILAYASNYNQWRVTDTPLIDSWVKAEFPSDELKIVTANGDTLYGQAAYDRITRGVRVGEAITAFENGEYGEQDLFGDE